METYKVKLGNVGNYGHLMPMICDCCCRCCCCYKNICFSSCFSIITHTSNLWQSPGAWYWIILLFFLFNFFFVRSSLATLSRQSNANVYNALLHCTPTTALVNAQPFRCALSLCTSHSPFSILHFAFPICHSPLPYLHASAVGPYS